MDQGTRDLLEKMVEQGPRANLAVYLELAKDSPEDAWLATSALRILARAGEIEADGIPALGACLEDAPDLACFTHLVKALAAFGRAAGGQGPRVVEQLEDIHVTDDGRFWALDSGLHALGYIGGEGAVEFVEKLRAESPNRVDRAKGVYEGELGLEERRAWFQSSLEKVRAQLDEADPGTWSKKMTDKTFAGPAEGEKKRSPWMTR